MFESWEFSEGPSAWVPIPYIIDWQMKLGDVAQLGEHRLCKPGVGGSSPLVSTGLTWLGSWAQLDGDDSSLSRRGTVEVRHSCSKFITLNARAWGLLPGWCARCYVSEMRGLGECCVASLGRFEGGSPHLRSAEAVSSLSSSWFRPKVKKCADVCKNCRLGQYELRRP